MAIDIRATVTCSLGTLISASLNDDYVQGTGLIKCKGSCEISGTITPAIGTVVTFSYTKGGVTTQVPRKLRVLSSFADPFRRTTKVELGCKLTYLQDLQEPVKWDAFDDSANSSLTEADAQIITIPIHASSVANKCLTELGITASSMPLTNKFSIAEFDFGSGYVSILSDLLVSESYCGYLDTSEVLQVFSLDQEGGTGPVLNSSSIIDLGPIGVGQLPGEAVTVSYSTLKLKQPDAQANPFSGWVSSATVNSSSYAISYTNPATGQQAVEIRNLLDSASEQTFYEVRTVIDQDNPSAAPVKKQLVTRRRIVESKSAAAVAGALTTAYLSAGVSFPDFQAASVTNETFEYDSYGYEKSRRLSRTADYLYVVGTLGLPMSFTGASGTDLVSYSGPDIEIERVVVKTTRAGLLTKTVTSRFGPWYKTVPGQQSIAEARDSFTTAAQVESYISKITSSSYLLDVSVNVQEGVPPAQRLPSDGEMINSSYADGGDPSNGFRTESTAELELALGSATAQRRIELSMPYAPDDTFTKVASTYSAISSDAAAKANRYGRSQNRLLLGNRNGMNVQAAPELLPAAPFSPVVVQANGLSALYRTNGTSYTMDASGIVVSSDLLFWGAVGGTGSFWFPVAPGTTTLPTTPPVVDGEMTVAGVIKPYNETVVATARTRSLLNVETFAYGLNSQLTELTLKTRSQLRGKPVVESFSLVTSTTITVQAI